jgi:beta-glucosidase
VQSWDPELMYAFGEGMGREQYLKGSNVMLGPGVNLARVPWNGRNFEYQGEDPWLASVMVASEVWGIQSQNVSGCVKHYVFNNEETDRSGMSANVGDRAAKELYYKPFAAAVDAGVGTAMCSCVRGSVRRARARAQRGAAAPHTLPPPPPSAPRYNRVNGTWACEDANSLNEIKTIQGFAGWMMSGALPARAPHSPLSKPPFFA